MEMTEAGWEGAEACGACGLSCAHLSSCFTCHLRDEGSDSCDVLWWGPVWSVKNRTDSNVTSWTSLLGCWPLPQTLDSLQPPKQWQALIQLACQCGCYLWGSCLSFLPHRHLEPSCVSLPNQECPLDLRMDSWLNVPFHSPDPNKITYSLSQPSTKLLWTAWRKEVPLWCGREKGFAFSEAFFLHICPHTPWWKETLWLSLNTDMSVYLIMIFPDS